MTDYQALQLLKGAGIVGARAIEDTGRLILMIRRGDSTADVPVAEFRSGIQSRIAALEEEKREVLRNSYAARAVTTFTVGGSAPLTMEALKSNDQLTKEERLEKTQRLMAVDAGIKKERSLNLALAHLQIHSKNLLPQLRVHLDPPPEETAVRHSSGKQLWTRGVKAAALFCLHEGQRRNADDQVLLEVCTEFVQRYEIKDEVDYSAERLFQNVRQVRLLDSYE